MMVRFAIKCMCHSNGVFVFSARRKKRKHQQKADGGSSGQWQKNLLTTGNGNSEQNFVLVFECCLPSMVVMK